MMATTGKKTGACKQFRLQSQARVYHASVETNQQLEQYQQLKLTTALQVQRKLSTVCY
jgi:hypothetical protein